MGSIKESGDVREPANRVMPGQGIMRTARMTAAAGAARVVAVLIAVVTCSCGIVFAEEDTVKTTVTGLRSSYSMRSYKKTISDEITVTPAFGRKVRVYFYDEVREKWVKQKTYRTENKRSSTIKIKYSAKWKQHYDSGYKVVVPRAELTEKALDLAAKEEGKKKREDGTYPGYEKAGTMMKKRSRKVGITNLTLPGAASLVMDAETGEVICERGMHEKRKIASVTKVMTAMLLVEHDLLNKKTKMTKEAAATPWSLGLKAGDKLSGGQIMKLMMVGSCNEAACQAGIMTFGSTKKYIKAANKRAEQLGARNTNYGNAHGIDVGSSHTDGNYSTVYDQALIASRVMTAKELKPVRKAVKLSKYYVKRRGRWIGRHNTNALIGKNGNVGLKTGTERKAGNCFVGAYKHEGRMYITVVLGASTSGAKWSATVNLRDYMKYSVEKGYKPFSA